MQLRGSVAARGAKGYNTNGPEAVSIRPGAEEIFMKRRHGFTLIELLIVISIISMLAALLLPALGNARRLAKQLKCRTNLSATGKGMVSYANEYGYRLPSFPSDTSQWNIVGDKKTSYAFTGVRDGSRPLFALMYSLEQDADKNWIRRELKYVKVDVFVCPSVGADDRVVDPIQWESGNNKQVGFDSWQSIHYSYQHSLEPDMISPVTFIEESTRVIMADRTPIVQRPGTRTGYDGDKTTATSSNTFSAASGNAHEKLSPNHGKEGHNLLRLDNSVTWTKDIVIDEDNIWLPGDTTGSSALSSGPEDDEDVFLVP